MCVFGGVGATGDMCDVVRGCAGWTHVGEGLKFLYRVESIGIQF